MGERRSRGPEVAYGFPLLARLDCGAPCRPASAVHLRSTFIEGKKTMATACACGMTSEAPSTSMPCRECGTVCCRSCALEVETHPYCRWCATTLTASA